MEHRRNAIIQECLNITDKLQTCSGHGANTHIIRGSIIVRRTLGISSPGKSASAKLYSRTDIDPDTGKGKLSEKSRFKHGKNTKHHEIKTKTYEVKFHVDQSFGLPGAIIIKNNNRHEFFLLSVSLETHDRKSIHFDCNSWVYPFAKTQSHRLFFSNTSYLPEQTPEAMAQLRKEELTSLRGDGTGERQEWDHIYDYDYYNDLGDPEKAHDLSRQVLGGSQTFPYPRRGRTGRPPTTLDPSTESKPDVANLNVYVPPDERFSPLKLNEFISNSIRSIVHFLIPEVKALIQRSSGNFESFEEIREMFSSNRDQALEGWLVEKLKKFVPHQFIKEIDKASKEIPRKFPLPQIISENELAWKDDEEFGRQMLAGINPVVLRSLENFPIAGSAIEASHIGNNLDDLNLGQAMLQRKIFVLDHHDYLLPFLNRINKHGVCAYASRTLLYLRNDASLKPLVIELTLPGSKGGEDHKSRVFLPAAQGTEAALWQLAKAHVVANDSGYHQLVSHWLHTHAVVEPFIIATRRQLSAMHPIHKLLEPHFKDTMHINALARTVIISAGGLLERTLFTGKVSMDITSAFYKNWRFDEQALPDDLLKRRMAMNDSYQTSGVSLLFEDYPYGADGLDIWTAILTWVRDYCKVFYTTDDSIKSDVELQAWWTEIRTVGHGDARKGWYDIDDIPSLTKALTTFIWIASALHASVNFGQYAYGGYPPNRPSICRKFIPEEGTFEYAEFLQDPDKYFLRMLPERFEMTLGVALVEILSRHASDEMYLGQRGLVSSDHWTDNEEVIKRFKKFQEDLKEVEKKIMERNRNPKLKNRLGPAMIPYTLMYPDTTNVSSVGGLTGKGIPNSVSI
ncbi:hypothetical protein Scep_010989 [Stephania cephalantha]|uniref:Lipoxygenase n=1 Tax=Stephania cephalantha TaxID=152367 RepID=A0AAP0PDT8_9MAGN